MKRPPDVYIGGRDDPYLLRWYIWPRNRWCNLYLHRFLKSDDDRALHDHPWASISVTLSPEGYVEVLPGNRRKYRRRFSVVFRLPTTAHRVEITKGPCMTLFLTGPKIREWGFLCPQGWRHWRDFTSGTDGETIGRGCD